MFPDVYVRAGVPLDHDVRVRAALVLFPDAVVCGRSAARLWGVDVDGPAADPDTPRWRWSDHGTLPTAAASAGRPQQRIPGLRVRRWAVLVRDVTSRGGLRVTTPTATALDLAAELPHDDGVVVLDQFCHAGPAALPADRPGPAPDPRRGAPVGAAAHGPRWPTPTGWPSHRRRPGPD